MSTIEDMLDPTTVERLRVSVNLDAPAKPRQTTRNDERGAAKRAAQEERAVLVARSRPQKKEQDVDLNNVPDAELGRHARNALVQSKTRKVKNANKAAKAKLAKQEAKDQRDRKKELRKRKNRFFKGFKVSDTLVIPDLDLRDAASLDETPSAKMRQPYNKARFRLLGEPPLPAKGNQPDEVDPVDSATYRTLIAEHERLREVVKDKSKVKAKKTTKKVVATFDPSAKAKIKALRKLGISEERAKVVLGL